MHRLYPYQSYIKSVTNTRTLVRQLDCGKRMQLFLYLNIVVGPSEVIVKDHVQWGRKVSSESSMFFYFFFSLID